MSNTKNNKKKDNKRDEFEERIMNVDRQYEDVPIDKKDPVIVKSQAIQTAHTMAMAETQPQVCCMPDMPRPKAEDIWAAAWGSMGRRSA